MAEATCRQIVVTGMVQGLGFRPYIYRLAQTWGLKGWVLNSGQGVTIEIQGPAMSIEGFCRDLPAKKPPLAEIVSFNYKSVPLNDYSDFRILESQRTGDSQVLVPPDLAICPECRAEVLAEAERYHYYPFTNCTHCGPRFTVIKSLPYDRDRTSMAEFPMCPECHQDYHNPGHRRFHAQPTACNFCGPQVTLYDKHGVAVSGDWLANLHKFIDEGKIIAVKGIGGFHLVCSALNSDAVESLRRAKKRPFRPFAVMAKDLETAKRYCHVSSEEAALLTSPAAPIVILDTIEGTIPAVLAPNNPTLGLMLPYSPLHLLLFSENVDLLVMTSGNASGLPIVKDNDEAFRHLAPFADYFLMHNREIISRCDDSVVREISGETQYLRRSRGYVPSPLQLAFSVDAHVLGMGSETKNTLCLLKDKNAFLSQHIGEMGSLESLANYQEILHHLKTLFEVEPLIIGYDPHPNSALHKVLKEMIARADLLQKPLATFPIQHHHAHLASVMADNGLEGDVIGVILDGTGYGLDNTLWGFEILVGNYTRVTRLIHLANVPLPGGEKAIRNPWIVASAYLLTNLGKEGKNFVTRLFPDHAAKIPMLERMIIEHINTPGASSAGRLFDAVAALLGVCLENTYDGQAAIELGELARTVYRKMPLSQANWIKTPYPFYLNQGILEISGLLREIIQDRYRKHSAKHIALKFHYTIAEMIVASIQHAHSATSLKRVVLSGGVWQNPLLLELGSEALIKRGFSVFTHRKVPANDGGLALGQAAAAYHMWLSKN